MRILDPMKEDEGKYTCSAANPAGVVDHDIILSVLSKPLSICVFVKHIVICDVIVTCDVNVNDDISSSHYCHKMDHDVWIMEYGMFCNMAKFKLSTVSRHEKYASVC